MSGVWGENLKISLFGESHGPGLGIVVNGLPAGIKLNLEYIRRELERRAPGRSELTTSRREADKFEIVSGYFRGKTTGAPLCFLIRNQDRESADYEKNKELMRPGHADYPARIKYAGFNDYRGGGHFSGRLTAPLVLAGAIAEQILEARNITIGSHILRIAEIAEEGFDALNIGAECLRELRQKAFPVLNEGQGKLMQQRILQAKEARDSVGGVTETAVVGLPVGLGSPFFDSVESKLAHLLFAVPAVKGLEFGDGFALSALQGSQANDAFRWQDGEVKTETNHCGGILGGLSTGMPLLFKTAFKPTPSIGKPQRTVDLARRENAELVLEGRHDPCIVLRAVPVVEAMAALALLDLLMEKDGTAWMV